RGAVSGPFSLAVSMVGAEALFVATLDDPDFVHSLLRYTSDIIRSFGKAYIDVGADVIIFDSQASADLLPPTMYEDFILEPMQQIVAYFAEQGVRDVPLIIGGTTTPLVDMLIATKANNLLCDYTCDWQTWLAKCEASNVAIRRNIDSGFILNSSPDDIYATARTHIKESEGFAGYILGTAVIPYGTPLKNILAVKQACLDEEG
ncbi:MAG: uroporphyrinogen decarboxylase family protein, partial [Bythopirellula sp.]